MATRRMYFRCNSGHLFDEPVCPFDGWSLEGFDDARFASIRIDQEGEQLTVQRLHEAGLPESVMKRIVIMEFGADNAVFEALDPNGFMINGKWVPLRKAGYELK